jgi:4-deoxy-L-threo-5-hexosulose-uronate ketol-isomerase
MEVRYTADEKRYETMSTEQLRASFLIEYLFSKDKINLVYTDADRAIVGAAVPGKKELKLSASKKEMAAAWFAERREVGIINIGHKGEIIADGKSFKLNNRDGLYIGRGTKNISFKSKDSENPAKFYILSYPAHREYPTSIIKMEDANQLHLGSQEESNERIIYQYIHEAGVKSCQLVMGFTQLAKGCVWNTMPAHTHQRRTEVYMYFDMKPNDIVVHLMGKPQNTRHLIIRNEQAVLSPSWSLHSGAATRSYAFIWGMGGENQAFADMDGINMKDLK